MNAKVSGDTPNRQTPKRFVSIDFARGIAIIIMVILHLVSDTLNIDELISNINDIPLINLLAFVILPYFGGLAGFFLLISAAGNMVSMYKALERGKSVRSQALKQFVGGFLLLIFAMLCEGLIGYHGVVGSFFHNLNNPANTDWQLMLWRWNYFETIHTIAWCVIINGMVQCLLSLKENWKNTKRMITAYIVLSIVVVGLTQPIWDLVSLIPGYPFGTYPNGHQIPTPWIGHESFWHILRAPFLAMLAAPIEPLFPYLAVSFIGSIIGIVISQPREKISKNFPRNTFLVGTVMFIGGSIGVIFSVIKILSSQGLDVAIDFYLLISYHRHWAPDFASCIPPFSWLGQFLTLNGFSLMSFMLLFRLVEFRGKSKQFADKTRIVRRFGTIAFTNYNNQWIYFFMFFLTSLMISQVPYQRFFWAGTFLTILLTLSLYSLILFGWEKIKYIGSLEWFIRTVNNNLVPARRESFDESVKWWQRGLIDLENTFYNPEWINLMDTKEEREDDEVTAQSENNDSKFALRLSIIGLCSILFIVLTIFSLFISISSRKNESKNKHNKTALIISIIGIVLLTVIIIVSMIIPIGTLGLF